jgi:acyl transferase domain-containing protein/acyl carrier protein/NADP-dependent 3-hydroxy acid dehydrogenase YdfG
MNQSAHKAVAIVGVGALMPDASNAPAFWQNIKDGRNSISEVQPDRWDADLYYDPDPKAPDKTYSKIGGWVMDWNWDPLKWKLPIPPRVGDAMDLTQKWAIIAARQALEDYGFPKRSLDPERTAVIFGNAMGGDSHLYSAARIMFPEYASELAKAPSFSDLPNGVREAIIKEMREGVGKRFSEITEDTMPGELSNIIAGRVAALYNFQGPNYVADAACASAMAAIAAAIEGLEENDYDAVITGGIDANMSAQTFVKFCKIGALSGTGTRPYDEGADGFVMGEGSVIFLIKRLTDAERDGDKIYAVIRALGGSSDGKGKGITAPNPAGQKLAIQRAWHNAGLTPVEGDMIEGHGTSTRVGDVAEVESLTEAFKAFNLPVGSVALGSVKSNIGHLKGAAGAAGMLKTTFALHEKMLPPSINFHEPNPGIDFAKSPFAVNTELKPWEANKGGVRRAGISAFGFGGTNFHAVMEEYIPGRIKEETKTMVSFSEAQVPQAAVSVKSPLRGALVIGAETESEIANRLSQVHKEAKAGTAPEPAPPGEADLRAKVRLAIDYGDAAELADKAGRALTALEENQPGRWKALRAKGIFLGRGHAPKVAFLFTGQGAQYVNMLRNLKETEPVVAMTFAEADRVMQPLLGKSLSDYIFLDESDKKAMAQAEEDLKQTAITQPAVLATETAIARLLVAYGVSPDMVMGHSLGEYGALVASGALSFEEALRAVSARGDEMTKTSLKDNGLMAAVFGPIEEIEKIISGVAGYVVIANINSTKEAVIGGSTEAVQKAMTAVRDAGYVARQLQVSHAFHTNIVGKASEGLSRTLAKMNLQPPGIPIVANISGAFYPNAARPNAVTEMIDILAKQVSSPVQFVKGLNTLYDAGARVFVEIGPKRVLYGFVDDVVGKREDVVTLFTNHPRIGDIVSINQALCGLFAAGLGVGKVAVETARQVVTEDKEIVRPEPREDVRQPGPSYPEQTESTPPPAQAHDDRYVRLGHLFTEFLDRGFQIYSGEAKRPVQGSDRVCITGASLGLPGVDRIFDDSNVERILRGDQFIEEIPMPLREGMANKGIVRLVKSKEGDAKFETIDKVEDVIKLAGRGINLDLARDFGFPEDRLPALDDVTRIAIGVGIDALRDAGIPLVSRYKTTTTGTNLPDRWGLPDNMRDDTGMIFSSAFPGLDSFAEIITGYHEDRTRRERLKDLESLRERIVQSDGSDQGTVQEIDSRIEQLRSEIKERPYHFDRRFLFRVLSMGHSQFAEYIGARGPNTQINGACASTTQAVAVAQDWIRMGRCNRVIIISADDVTTDNLVEWFGSGFLASGAAATDGKVEDAATPFDRRRHGMIIGMGGAGLVVESQESVRERGIQPICDVLSSISANSAFHGSRLDVNHICDVMETLISQAETDWGINRYEIAPETVFVSHETYTPARGGSASAEVFALRHVFGSTADQIVVANTKGSTGHAMGVGIEDVVAVKILETGVVPPVPNFKEVDPELGPLNLSRGGSHPVRYALRLGAGFGSQISMTLTRWVPTVDGKRRRPSELGYAYRIVDQAAWKSWLCKTTGYEEPETEVAHRTLRIKDKGPAVNFSQSAPTTQVAHKQAQANSLRTEIDSKVAQPVAAAGPAQAAEAITSDAKSQIPTTPVAEPAPSPAIDPVQEKVLQIISEKSGYPPDMLELDLDLEADLGIDTVKQAEMFAAIREAYNIPRDDNLKLRDFPTLTHAVRFVYDRRPDLNQQLEQASSEEQKTEGIVVPLEAAQASTTIAADPVKEKVMQIIAEKTGYPPDMLDLDLDLEADLGIDTVKQAEMFAAIREAYDIPRDDSLKLRDFPTLAHSIQFVYDRRPDLKEQLTMTTPEEIPAMTTAPAEEALPAKPAAVSASGEDPVRTKVMEIISEKTGYPPDMLDLDLDLEADLGIDTVKQAEMFAAIREAYDIPRDDTLQLRDFPTLAHTIQFVYDRRPDLKEQAVATPVEIGVANGPVETIESGPITEASISTSTAVDTDPVREQVLKIIAEKTGYPPDMLDLDLDLEADLGIDTVKQAEMFASIREAYDIPRDDNLQLRDFPTLAHTIQFVYDRRPDLKEQMPATEIASATAPSAETSAAPTSIPEVGGFVASMDAANQIPRRVPIAHLRPSLDLCKPTGVTLNANSRVIVMTDRGGVGKTLAGRLKKLGMSVLMIDDCPAAETFTKRIEEWKSEGPIQGVFWLPALDHEGEIAGMSLDDWREATRVRVKLLYATMRALCDQLDRPGTFLVSATRLGGQHGYDDAGAIAPLGGAVAGFTKAYKREAPEALVKVVDFEPGRKTTAFADLLVHETLRDPGLVEVGYKYGQRWAIGLEEKPTVDGEGGIELNKDSVFLITGAAGSIVSAITTDLASAAGGIFHLLDLAPEPDPNNPDLRRFSTDKEGLKRDIFERIKSQGNKATPVMVEKELGNLERAHAASTAIQAIENAGGKAHYHSVNLLDAEAVANIMKDIADECGRIDVLVHAAGLEISHLLPDKEPNEFDLVFDVKCDGWFNLVSNLGDMPLGAAMVFSSIAGRFGNAGQTDYAAANDLLCKSISNMRKTRPETRGIAIDWTAWGGIGMAARGSIPAVMKQAGIDMLQPEAGIPIVRREVLAGTNGEIVVAGNLGIMLNDFDESGGLDTDKDGALSKLLQHRGVMSEKIAGMGLYRGLTVETALDPAKQPFLYDHKINDTPVLPGVMGIEAMVEAATVLFPDRYVGGVEDVNFLLPFKFYRGEPRTVTVQVQYQQENEDIVADCQLIGSRKLHAKEELEVTTHFTARVRLVEEPRPVTKGKRVNVPRDGKKVESGEIYQLYFHGPAYQVVEKSWRAGKDVIGRMAQDLPPNHEPAELATLAEPRIIELCFQTAGILEMGIKGRMALPYHIDRVDILGTPDGNQGRLHARVRPGPKGGFDAEVVDSKGNICLTMRTYQTSELPDAIDSAQLRPLKTALE